MSSSIGLQNQVLVQQNHQGRAGTDAQGWNTIETSAHDLTPHIGDRIGAAETQRPDKGRVVARRSALRADRQERAKAAAPGIRLWPLLTAS